MAPFIEFASAQELRRMHELGILDGVIALRLEGGYEYASSHEELTAELCTLFGHVAEAFGEEDLWNEMLARYVTDWYLEGWDTESDEEDDRETFFAAEFGATCDIRIRFLLCSRGRIRANVLQLDFLEIRLAEIHGPLVDLFVE